MKSTKNRADDFLLLFTFGYIGQYYIFASFNVVTITIENPS